jgi:hypothetical protein
MSISQPLVKRREIISHLQDVPVAVLVRRKGINVHRTLDKIQREKTRVQTFDNERVTSSKSTAACCNACPVFFASVSCTFVYFALPDTGCKM